MKHLLELGTAAAVIAASLAASLPARAHAESTASAPTEMSRGEIRGVDKDAARLTIRHGELKNLGMPAMTMVFRVKDPAMVGQVKVGDQVRFVAEKVDGALTVTLLDVPSHP